MIDEIKHDCKLLGILRLAGLKICRKRLGLRLFRRFVRRSLVLLLI